MSDFKVTIEKVEAVYTHPNAERLELVKLVGKGHTIIGGKGSYKGGDLVVFFPPDSVLPKDLIEAFQLMFLHKGNRVKETKIRNIISQALILPLQEVLDFSDNFSFALTAIEGHFAGADFSVQLGVTKYEPEESVNLRGVKENGKLPLHVERYDLENAENFPEILQLMLNERVIVTEKLEGTNWGLHIDSDWKISALKRSSAVKDDGNPYHQASIDTRMDEMIRAMKEDIKCDTVTLRGELVGESVQSNIYGLKGRDVYLFDIMIDGKYVSPNMFFYLIRLFNHFNPKTVPIVFDGLMSDYAQNIEQLKLMSNAPSALNDKVLREGIVIKSCFQDYIHGYGRLVLKQRSPEYLANSKL